VTADARDREDVQFLLANAREARAMGFDQFIHFDHPVGAWNYVRIANEIASDLNPCRLLDWGCGFGQMTYLLRRRGFEVVAFDVGAADAALPAIPLCRDLQIVRSSHPTELPFPATSFDAVLSCGVLEHVDEFSQPGNEARSLGELRRVLRQDGVLSIYQLPQRHAWQEAIVRALRLGYAHPRRYTEGEIRALLAASGFETQRVRRNNLVPKNLTGVPDVARSIYGSLGRALVVADTALSHLPGVNRLAGVLEVFARAAEPASPPLVRTAE
jgi:SAM-dependent methyltransferase